MVGKKSPNLWKDQRFTPILAMAYWSVHKVGGAREEGIYGSLMQLGSCHLLYTKAKLFIFCKMGLRKKQPQLVYGVGRDVKWDENYFGKLLGSFL